MSSIFDEQFCFNASLTNSDLYLKIRHTRSRKFDLFAGYDLVFLERNFSESTKCVVDVAAFGKQVSFYYCRANSFVFQSCLLFPLSFSFLFEDKTHNFPFDVLFTFVSPKRQMILKPVQFDVARAPFRVPVISPLDFNLLLLRRLSSL